MESDEAKAERGSLQRFPTHVNLFSCYNIHRTYMDVMNILIASPCHCGAHKLNQVLFYINNDTLLIY